MGLKQNKKWHEEDTEPIFSFLCIMPRAYVFRYWSHFFIDVFYVSMAYSIIQIGMLSISSYSLVRGRLDFIRNMRLTFIACGRALHNITYLNAVISTLFTTTMKCQIASGHFRYHTLGFAEVSKASEMCLNFWDFSENLQTFRQTFIRCTCAI